jgi:hypothetical protein
MEIKAAPPKAQRIGACVEAEPGAEGRLSYFLIEVSECTTRSDSGITMNRLGRAARSDLWASLPAVHATGCSSGAILGDGVFWAMMCVKLRIDCGEGDTHSTVWSLIDLRHVQVPAAFF